ncbi:MAG: 30S ribosomal protein S4 [Candidatus Marsarchaeota archaeon]|nr:30S ribosomal protein S4 [Candidatus Marsarchaeota archaeon]MCL5095083.1 30S ribosomal protein S4 [Candidatus Marsarchaeota archaeon]
MGSIKRNRKKYETPKNLFNTERIKQDRAIIKEFGLKNMKELWQAQSKISKIRRNVRTLLSGESEKTGIEKDIINRLIKLGIVNEGVILDDLLDLNEKEFLERRLESIVFRKGLAKSMKQARQIIVHGFIAINSKKIDKPGYMVNKNEEQGIAYYKKIDINKNNGQNEKSKDLDNEEQENRHELNNENIAIKTE